jgi:3-hydroxyisobutyrate dehydrogenase-like beta-hydroxyacid dehydrogenase
LSFKRLRLPPRSPGAPRIRITASTVELRQLPASGLRRGHISLPQASTADVSTACETQMPDQESVFRPVSAQPLPENRSGSLSNTSPPPEQKLVEGRIGFIGLGRMGLAMATNLARNGCKVIGFVRHPERLKELFALGLEPSVEIADLFDCSIVITMLPDDRAVREVVFGSEMPIWLDGLSARLKPGSVHLSMSTISTRTASELAAGHARCGQGYVAAPVFGNPDAAKARQLFVIAGGAAADVERCRPIFDILGQRTFVVGTDPATANLIKLAGNVMTATAVEMLGEVLALARKSGVDPKRLLDILTETMFGSRAHKIYGAKIAAQLYAPGGFVFPLALKDVRLALAEAEAAGVPMPSVSVVRDRLITGMARGYAELDWSALGLLAAEEAGLGTAAQHTGMAAPR